MNSIIKTPTTGRDPFACGDVGDIESLLLGAALTQRYVDPSEITAGDFVFRTVCAVHNFRPFVGKNVAFALDEYECPTCIADADRVVEERRFRIENSYWGTLTGHHPECLCSHCFQEDEPPFSVAITSPNWCDHQGSPETACFASWCTHALCNAEPPF